MERFLGWTNTVASWFVDPPLGWQLLLALLLLPPRCFVSAQVLLLPIIDVVENAYRRRVDVHNVIEPALVGRADKSATAGTSRDAISHTDSQ